VKAVLFVFRFNRDAAQAQISKKIGISISLHQKYLQFIFEIGF